jgi:pyruvate dehydrogenase E1 component
MFGAGFNHFWHAESEDHGGDLLYIQGHARPASMPAPSSKAA